METYDFGLKGANVKILGKTIDNVTKSNKCNQCDFASSQAGDLRKHLKTHSGEKANKCNQCNYASAEASDLRRHLKTHSGEKSNKCNQCDFACSDPNSLRRHMKRHRPAQKGEKLLFVILSKPSEDSHKSITNLESQNSN